METQLRKSYNGLPTFLGFFEDHIDEISVFAKSTGWKEKTEESYRIIVKDKIVPALINHDYRSILDYDLEDYESALRAIEKKGKGNPGEPFVPYKDSTLEKYRFLIIAVVTVAARYGLSMDLFSKEGKNRSTKGKNSKKQFIVPKSLTVSQEIDVANYLKTNINKQGQVVGLLLMFAEGVRNAEACGVSFGHIKEMNEYPGKYYLRTPQTTEIDSFDTKLGGKSINSPRSIPLPDDVAALLFEIRDYRLGVLRKNGNTQIRAEDLPIACRDDDYTHRCSADDLTEAGRKMFIQTGMLQEDFCELGRELSKTLESMKEANEEDIFDLYEKDPSSYLLRRNFATHMMLLGLTETEMMYVIGHKMEDAYVERSSYTDEKMLMQIKRKMDKRPILNIINCGEEITLCAGETVKMSGVYRETYKISTSQVQKIRLDVEAKEPGDSIEVTSCVKNHKLWVTKECGISISPRPDRLPRTINVQKVYHEAYQKEQRVDLIKSAN